MDPQMINLSGSIAHNLDLKIELLKSSIPTNPLVSKKLETKQVVESKPFHLPEGDPCPSIGLKEISILGSLPPKLLAVGLVTVRTNLSLQLSEDPKNQVIAQDIVLINEIGKNPALLKRVISQKSQYMAAKVNVPKPLTSPLTPTQNVRLIDKIFGKKSTILGSSDSLPKAEKLDV